MEATAMTMTPVERDLYRAEIKMLQERAARLESDNARLRAAREADRDVAQLNIDNALLRQALRLLIDRARRVPVAEDAGGRTAGVAIHLEEREYDWAAGVLGGYAAGEGDGEPTP